MLLYLTKHHAMKAYWRSGCTASGILNVGTRRRWVVSFTSWPLYTRRKVYHYPLNRWLILLTPGMLYERVTTGVNKIVKYVVHRGQMKRVNRRDDWNSWLWWTW